MAFYFVSTFAIAQTPTKQPALRLSRTKNLHFAKAPFPGFSAIVNAEGKNGAYLLIDGDSDKIYITEGLATGLTVAFATGNTVAVALDAGNIIHVAESLAGQNITIAADNDAGNNGNTGILKAIEAAKKFGCKVVAPNTEYKADYNDIFIEGGIDSVRTHLANKIKVEKNRFSFELQRIKSLPEAQKPKAVKKAVAAGMAGVPFKYSLGDVVSRVSSVYPNIEPIIESANYLLKKKEEAVSQYMNFDDGEFTRVAPNAETILRAGGVYILNWGMGAGKTKFMCEVAAAAEKNNLSTMYLTHRVAIVDNAATRLGATHYQDVNELDMRHVRTLVSCINSLTKPYIAAYAADAGVLKIDEVRQVLEAIATRGVAIFAKACFGHPSPSKRQKLNATAMPSAPRFVLVTTSRPNRGSEHWLQMT